MKIPFEIKVIICKILLFSAKVTNSASKALLRGCDYLCGVTRKLLAIKLLDDMEKVWREKCK